MRVLASDGDRGEERPAMPVHAFCSPQKVCRCTVGRSPGFEGDSARAVDRFTLSIASPSPATRRVADW